MTTKIRAVHASLDTFMSDAKNVEDVLTVASLGPDYATFTEQGDDSVVHKISKAVQAKLGAAYQVVNPDKGDILFIVKREHRILAAAGPLSIPGQPGPARLGGHGPRHNSYVSMRIGNEQVTHTGVHFVTAHPDHQHNTGDRRDQQVKQAEDLGKQMKAFSRGRAIATGSGDLNAQLPGHTGVDEVFDKWGLTTTSEETGDRTPTHGNARLDYFWTTDRDGRVSVTKMMVRRGSRFNSDHDPVDVWLEIKG